MTLHKEQAAIRAIGKIEEIRNDIRLMSASLDNAGVWTPSRALKRQCAETLRIIDSIEERIDRMLVISIIGSSGSGKSTLLNALAGVDNLSESGDDRPTTRKPVVLGRNRSDADILVKQLGSDSVDIKSSSDAATLEFALLVDTPDMDGVEADEYIHLVHKAIDLSDVLICMFNAENPKRKDYVDFLTPYIKRFDGESLICVLNRCDRLDESELKQVILPDFSKYIADALGTSVERVFCISARNHLNDPRWDSRAVPKHDFDEYDQLKNLIFGSYSRAGFVIDRRIENIEQLQRFIRNEVLEQVEKDRPFIESGLKTLRQAETGAVKDALGAVKREKSSRMIGINVLLYQKLAQKWMGPVGWVIAVWARILIFGAGVTALFRFGNPIAQIYGMVSSLRKFKETRAAVADAGESRLITQALRDYRLRIVQDLPDIIRLFTAGRFESGSISLDRTESSESNIGEELSSIWNEALDDVLEEHSQNLSRFLFQIALNLPGSAILVYVGWIATDSFFKKTYLSGEFFVHALFTMLFIIFICFFLFQIIVRLFSGGDRIAERAFSIVKEKTDSPEHGPLNFLKRQAELVLRLSALSGENSAPASSAPDTAETAGENNNKPDL